MSYATPMRSSTPPSADMDTFSRRALGARERGVRARRAVCVGVVLMLAAAGCDWAQFRGDPTHSGYQGIENTLSLSSAENLSVSWSAVTGTAMESSPAVAGGVVYVGGDNGTVYAFSAAGGRGCSGTPKTCTPLWTATTGAAVTSSPAVANGVVYIGSNDGKLYTYDAAGTTNCAGTPKTCTPLWTATTGGPVTSSPAAANGVVYIGSNDGKLYAYGAGGTQGCAGTPKTCTPLWTATTGGPVTSSPAAANGVVYVGSNDGSLYAYDAVGAQGCSGTPLGCVPLWSFTTGGAVSASPAVANGALVAASGDGSVYSLTPCSESPTGWGPCDIQNAYRLPSYVGGVGRTVGLVDAYDNPNAEADLAVYRSTYGLAPCTTANGCFHKVNQNGVTGNYPTADRNWAFEISLDLDMVSAACPRCHIVLVEASSNSFTDLGAAADQAATQGATVVSNSYGGTEWSGETSFASHWVHTGVPNVASSGDGGYAGGALFPAVVPSVTAVGGTILSGPLTTTTGRPWSEAVWNQPGDSAGSGCSAYIAKPSYQTDPGCGKRTVTDMAAVAQNLAVYDTYPYANVSPGWLLGWGTSAASPIVASSYALAGASGTNATLYGASSTFYDVTSGNNGTCGGSYLCTAGAGYDGPTGIGTPCGVGAFGSVFASPGGCGGAASAATRAGAQPQLIPSAPSTPTRITPACPPAPPGYARCLSYVG